MTRDHGEVEQALRRCAEQLDAHVWSRLALNSFEMQSLANALRDLAAAVAILEAPVALLAESPSLAEGLRHLSAAATTLLNAQVRQDNRESDGRAPADRGVPR